MFKVDDKLNYIPGGVEVTVLEVYTDYMVVDDEYGEFYHVLDDEYYRYEKIEIEK